MYVVVMYLCVSHPSLFIFCIFQGKEKKNSPSYKPNLECGQKTPYLICLKSKQHGAHDGSQHATSLDVACGTCELRGRSS